MFLSHFGRSWFSLAFVLAFFVGNLFFLPLSASPKLVIGIVVDQMRWDYLYRYADRYQEGGFKRLRREGYGLHHVLIPYLPTYTACGHASIYTGSTPTYHGIVGNAWPQKDGKIHNSVYDEKYGQSPVHLNASTVGDELKWMTNETARVFSIALKDRAAILPGGHKADAAFWWDGKKEGWRTSPYYMAEIPAWVRAWNANKEVEKYAASGWHTLYPLPSYTQSTKDSKSYEQGLNDPEVSTFPYVLKGDSMHSTGEKIVGTPFGINLSFDFAKALIAHYKLGNNSAKVPDFLAISLSSPDYIGHAYGPNSVEIEDTYLRLDTLLSDFIDYVEERVGKENCLFFLSADHGVSPVPAYLKERTMPAEAMDMGAKKKELEKYIQAQFPKLKNRSPIRFFVNSQLYIDKVLLTSAKIPYLTFENALLEYLNAQPDILNAVSLHNPFPPSLGKAIRARLAQSVHAKNSGDIELIFQPFHIEGWWSKGRARGTTHGSWYNYDAHIPLIFYGGMIPSGLSYQPYFMTDIAPTLSALLHIPLPSSSIGRPISEILPSQEKSLP